YGGDGLAKLPADERGAGKSVFVPFVLEGEQAEITLTEQKPGFARGRLDRLVQASGHRIQGACPYFTRCGGCHYQHSDYAHQLEIKASVLRETLKRTAKLDLDCELFTHASPEWNYRNRTRLKVQAIQEFALGYYRFRSHDLLPVEQCPISSPLINRAITATWELGRTGSISAALREIEFFADHRDEALLIDASCTRGIPSSDAHQIAEQLSHLLPEVQGVAVFELPEPNQFAAPKRIAGFGKAESHYLV